MGGWTNAGRAATCLLLALLLVAPAGLRGAQPAGAPELCDPNAPAAVTPNDHFVQPESTRRMAALIRRIYREADPLLNQFRSADQVPLLQAQEKAAATNGLADAKLFDLKMQLGTQLLQSGRFDEALAKFEELERFPAEHQLAPDPTAQILVLTGKAMCHLRAGETANCLLNHNADSCIFPIKDGGVHQLTEGSRGAIVVLNELLARSPGDLRARWLLNIAYMTLGEYPGKVPAKLLLDPKLFQSEYNLPRYPDVAANVGLDVDGLAGGVVMEDFDRDGFLDLMISAWGFTDKDQLRVFRNQGDGTFAERTAQAGLTGLISGLNLIHADYNNDGFADVLVLRGGWLRTEGHYPMSLLRNNGDFTFTDVTEESGLLHFKPTQTAAWWDYNGDGWLDLYVANESTERDDVPNELFRNNGDGTFTECAAEHGVALVGFYKGVASGDFNNDGRPDLFLSCQQGPKVLLRNDGPAGSDRSPRARWHFTDVAEPAGIAGPTHSFPCWFWDYDNDGWQDIMVMGYSITDIGDQAADYLGRPHPGMKTKLYRNNGDGTFSDVSRAAGVNRLIHAMGVNFGDLDNDGWLDFYAGTGNPDFATLMPNRMFRNDAGKRFQDVTTAGGFGQLQKGHGIAFGDIDNDGDQDIFSKVGGAVETDNYPSQLFANPGFGNHWLKLQLQGTKTNRAAIGARIKVVAREAGAQRVIYRTVGTGASFGSNPLRQEIGLGRADTVERVEIFWPVTGLTQVVTGLQVDQCFQICEGRPAAVPVALHTFTLPLTGRPGGHHHHGQ
ncbi:MAG TPA: FG-GAP-like repeat-containing protein [Lacunisphaera sp.]|nr:FG-GAP-like repeat-containing protein [Lacunisphaera sp.]